MALISGKTLFGSFLFSVFLFLSQVGMSQENIFPENDGDIVYTNQIISDSINQITLWENALDYLGSLELINQVKGQEAEIDNEGKKAMASQGFYLLKKGVVTKQIEGVIESTTTIRIIPGGYAYSINNILYQPYARNRYGKYAPKSSKKYSLESIYKKKSSKEWIQHFDDINRKIEEIIYNLESKMSK